MRPDAPSPSVPRRRSFVRTRRVAIVVALILIVALAGLWIDRKPIAEGYMTRTLAAAHVPARYTLAALGPGRQRLTNIVVGDPARPDLVADWIETETVIGLGGARLTGIRAGHVRLRATLAGGRVSLGAIDRLLPVSSGAPFALPAVDLAITDARVRLATPAGVVGVKIAGTGRLNDGFRGTVAAVAERIAANGCAATRIATALQVAIRSGKPMLTGPVRIAGVDCGGARAAAVAADLDATLAADLTRWTGRVAVTTQRLAAKGFRAAHAQGDGSFDGDAQATQGRIAVSIDRPSAATGTARTLAIAGTYRIADADAFVGNLHVDHALLASAATARIAAAGMAAAGTPVAPIARAVTHAAAAATRDIGGDAAVSFAWRAGTGALRIESARIATASGVRATLGGGAGIRIGWPGAAATIDTDLALGGGGLPGIRASLRQAGARDPVRGIVTVDRYAVGDATLALTPVAFAAGPSGTRIRTIATLSGPIASGRVEGLTLPIDAAWDGGTRLVVDDRCTSLAFDRLALSGLALGATRLGVCPVDGAIVRIANGRVGGGASLRGVRIAGTSGGSPLSIAADTAVLRIADPGVAIEGLRLALGPPDHLTRLDIATLAGTGTGAGIAGTFAGGSGAIANVPLLLRDATGGWRFAGGSLSLTGALGVADAGTPARFKPLAARGVMLTLAGGRIDATGALYEPTRGVKVADVAIRHDLGGGAGTADLTVPSLAFTDTFQPDLLTPLTYGVIAEVRGTVTGRGHIAWSPAGVSSTGDFRTGAIDLAAAFGPVTGLAGDIRFTDLLSLQSAPGQVAIIRTINPGIAVNDGRIVYRIDAGGRVEVDSGRWPFAGGALTLDPTSLDFSSPAARRITFRVDGAAADQFLQQFDFKNLDATGVFDGVLPMIFDDSGGRIEQGQLTVRGGGGSIAYVGDLTQKDLGFWGNLAFQALKSLRYRRLSITMNGPLSGEMVTAVRFAGVSQGQGAKSNFLIRRLQRLPFVFNVTIRAPFRGLLDSAASFYDPTRLIERNLPALLEAQDKQGQPPPPLPPPPPPPIQPPASRTMP